MILSFLASSRLLFLPCFIVFCLWLLYEIHKSNRKNEKAEREFWERERQANLTRKQPLNDLTYITVPMELIPKSLLSDDEKVREYIKTLEKLKDDKIVNLTGLTNTELKLKYGAPNLDLLSRYDDNYTTYARTMYRLAEKYHAAGYESNARILLEKAVESGTDVADTYRLLGKIYAAHEMKTELETLTEKARALDTLTSKAMVADLEKLLS
ncbi:MAG: hypothetical protein K6G07_00545 [Lachnospiraceae bacterium]|nr:hypothetical protein [Lachnospiraceae bacterium]